MWVVLLMLMPLLPIADLFLLRKRVPIAARDYGTIFIRIARLLIAAAGILLDVLLRR